MHGCIKAATGVLGLSFECKDGVEPGGVISRVEGVTRSLSVAVL